MNAPRTIAWIGGADGHVRLIDQTQLPTEVVYRDCRTVEEIWEAIRSLRGDHEGCPDKPSEGPSKRWPVPSALAR